MAKGFDLADYASLARTGLYAAIGGAIVYAIYKSNALGAGGKLVDSVVGSVTDAAVAVKDYWDNGTGKLMLWAGGNLDGIEATSAYVVIRKRDFNSQWQISDTAYKAAKGMHQDNERILKTYVLDGMGLKKNLQNIVKLTDFVVIYPNGEIKSA